MARNYKRDRRGRFARVASSAGKSYVRAKSRRVDKRKARAARRTAALAPTRARVNAVRSSKGFSNAKRVAKHAPAAIEIGGLLLGAGQVAGSRAKMRNARVGSRGIAAKISKVKAVRPNRKGVYNVTTLRGKRL